MSRIADHLRYDRAALESELSAAGASINGSSVRCPMHDDKNASGSIHQKDGVWKYTCHTSTCAFSGDVFDVKAWREGKTVGDVLKAQAPRRLERPASLSPDRVYSSLDLIEPILEGRIEKKFFYNHPDTKKPELLVLRLIKADGKKDFRQLTPVDGGYLLKGPPKPWPLYNRARVRDSEGVLVVEGEKCVHALWERAGLVATTSPGGAGKASQCDWSPLAGKSCYLWPDNDKPGLDHMREVSRILESLDPPARCFWIEPEELGLKVKADVADLLAEVTLGKEEAAQFIEGIIAGAEPMGAAKEVSERLEAIISGAYTSLPWPWPKLGKLTQALRPATVTLICGDPGATKSFFLLSAASQWHEDGTKFALLEMEDDRAFHLQRMLAQWVGESKLCDDDWVKGNPLEVRNHAYAWEPKLDSIGRCVFEGGDKDMTLNDVADWVNDRAKAGCRIIAVDPITAAAEDGDSWKSDRTFMMRVKGIVKSHGASLVLVTHPKKGKQGGMGLDNLAGGAAYSRFSHTVLWIEAHKQKTEVEIMDNAGTYKTDINRTIHIAKARNGRGAGLNMGFQFNYNTFRFEERGVIRTTGRK